MKQFKFAVLGLALGSTVSIASDCVQPDMPVMPDGASASMEDMLNGQKAVKTFQAANMDYMKCLEEAHKAAEAAAASDRSEDDKKAAWAAFEGTYNEAVSKEEEVAGQFNTEIREYKAANP